VGRHDLVHGLGEHQVADLRTGVDVVYRLEGVGIPKSDTPVSRASSAGQESILMGRPSYSFHSSRVLSKLSLSLSTGEGPNHKFVVITPGC
jgi:hypothetical protein